MEFREGHYLPAEIMEKIMLSANRRDLKSLCSLNHITASICRDELFWKQKLLIDYGTTKNIPGLSYKESWMYHSHVRIAHVITEERGFDYTDYINYRYNYDDYKFVEETILNEIPELYYSDNPDVKFKITGLEYINENDIKVYVIALLDNQSVRISDIDFNHYLNDVNEILEENGINDGHLTKIPDDEYEDSFIYTYPKLTW
jgi:hypothetical protein